MIEIPGALVLANQIDETLSDKKVKTVEVPIKSRKYSFHFAIFAIRESGELCEYFLLLHKNLVESYRYALKAEDHACLMERQMPFTIKSKRQNPIAAENNIE